MLNKLLYETVTAAHLTETQDVLHCTRFAFKESVAFI